MRHKEANQNEPEIPRALYMLRSDGKHADERPLIHGLHYRGYLPHLKCEGSAYFVTFRLYDSLPQQVFMELLQRRDEQLKRLNMIQNNVRCLETARAEIQAEFSMDVERYLDKGLGECHLQRPEIAELVAGAMSFFHNQRYILDEWVIMPNHVHAIVCPLPQFSLSSNLKSWKQFTSLRAKKILGLPPGKFWQEESYDHWIRDDEEKAKFRNYIRNNPVAAGFCNAPEDWKWGSAGRK